MYFLNFIIISTLFMSCTVSNLNTSNSEHFDGERFFFPKNPMEEKTLLKLLEWKMNSKATPWPELVEVEQQKIRQERVVNNEAHVTFINHSTTLIQMNG